MLFRSVIDKQLTAQISVLEHEKETKIFDRIKHLTADNPRLTFEAIDILKNSEAGKKLILTEEKRLERKLDVEDYRQNKLLRTLVIDTLIQKNIEKFVDILSEHEAKINDLKQTDVF